MRVQILLIPLAAVLAGCPVMQRVDTPAQPIRSVEPKSGTSYRVYVPSYHTRTRAWPLVITLHGPAPFDSPKRQVQEWQWLAEQHGLIVVAPSVRSSAGGIGATIESVWMKRLASDEQAILSLIVEMNRKYNADKQTVLLTAASTGGYAMYYTGLRNPSRFSMLIARGGSSSLKIFEQIRPTDAARELPIWVLWGKDELQSVQRQSWQAFRYLREHGYRKTEKREERGGTLRRPELTFSFWQPILPEQYRRNPRN